MTSRLIADTTLKKESYSSGSNVAGSVWVGVNWKSFNCSSFPRLIFPRTCLYSLLQALFDLTNLLPISLSILVLEEMTYPGLISSWTKYKRVASIVLLLRCHSYLQTFSFVFSMARISQDMFEQLVYFAQPAKDFVCIGQTVIHVSCLNTPEYTHTYVYTYLMCLMYIIYIYIYLFI